MVMKQKIVFHCTNCDYRPPRWVGNCSACNEWGSIVELKPQEVSSNKLSTAITLKHLDELSFDSQIRMLSGISEWDRVVGGGIMPGSYLILTGDPGIGKSTLLLQVAHGLSQDHSVFYFSSEESLEQVKRRSERLRLGNTKILFSDQAQLESIIAIAQEKKPDILIIDSVQNCYSSEAQVIPGTVGQLREAAFLLMRLAKENNIAILLTGHITKEGVIAGPKVLEHMVDGVLYLQGEDRWQLRVLRSIKNRFGTINEIGFFEMNECGLSEVPNINEQLLNEISYTPGSVLVSYIEGTRPLLLELQTLCVASRYGVPARVISGVDPKQVALIIAVLEKYLNIQFSSYDIFLKISGGFKIKESVVDLGIALALLSSYYQKPLPQKFLSLGEISLTGQIKPINQINMHLNEAKKFGIDGIIIAKNQKCDEALGKVVRLQNVYDLLSLFVDE